MLYVLSACSGQQYDKGKKAGRQSVRRLHAQYPTAAVTLCSGQPELFPFEGLCCVYACKERQ
jgi:hypothetical protein